MERGKEKGEIRRGWGITGKLASSIVVSVMIAVAILFGVVYFQMSHALLEKSEAMLQTTIAFTMQSGSDACNVLPQEASVSANMRFIPHQGERESLEVIRELAARYGLEMEIMHSSDYTKPVDVKGGAFRQVEQVIGDTFPGLPVCPYVMTGATDASFYQAICDNCIRFAPVVAGPEDDSAIREEDLPALREEYDRLAAEMIKRKKEGEGFNFFHFMIDLEGGPCVAKRLSGCGSGTEYLAVTPWGDLYPCHQFVGNEDFLMGNVEEGVLRTDIRDEFKGCNVYAKEKCRKCFAKFYCSGGCAANAYNFHGNINEAYDVGCELERKRVECAIMLKVAEAEL